APAEPIGEDLSLFPHGSDQAIKASTVLRALAYRVDLRCGAAREVVAHDDPTVYFEPGRTARYTFGLIPAATTTMSACRIDPSRKIAPVTCGSPSTAVAVVRRWRWMPICSISRPRIAPASASSCVSITWDMRWSTWTSRPRLR